jgi:hypothetical protein
MVIVAVVVVTGTVTDVIALLASRTGENAGNGAPECTGT